MTPRPMHRQDRQLPQEEAWALLTQGTYGVLSVVGDEGWPYAVPMHYTVMEGLPLRQNRLSWTPSPGMTGCASPSPPGAIWGCATSLYEAWCTGPGRMMPTRPPTRPPWPVCRLLAHLPFAGVNCGWRWCAVLTGKAKRDFRPIQQRM
ncbi:MAG: pyridoxamine 5'-phosphate oxidase family protein [Evtepia sp.]